MRVWVYILECADGRFYVGSHRGEDLDVRISEHNDGKYPNAWTYTRRPVGLAWADYYDSVIQAITVERQIKGWSRAKKLALIRGEVHLLKGLAKRKKPF